MRIHTYGALAGAFGLTLLMSQPATAATRTETYFISPAQSCQLSIPTTNTGVRPRASGYRNEGTASAFVICGFHQPSVDIAGLIHAQLGFTSFDGLAHSFSCTAVNGVAGYSDLHYVTKTVNVPSTAYTWVDLIPADFGGGTVIPDSYVLSVTCNLPPGVAINYGSGDYAIEIGS